MSPLLRRLAQYAIRKAASDPELRDKIVRTAQTTVAEARQIAEHENRAYAAGRAFRRAIRKVSDG